MGFLSSIWKGLTTGLKSIGKSVKSAFQSVGKFAGKFGIVGQIGLMFALPAIGSFLTDGLMSSGAALAASDSSIVSGIGTVLQTAGKFASTIGNVYKTVTHGISSFVSNIGKGFINSTASTLGANSPLISSGPASISEGFQNWMNGVHADVAKITSPFSEPAKNVIASVNKGYAESFDRSKVLDWNPVQKDFRFYEVPKPDMLSIKNAETTGLSSIFDKTKQGLVNFAGRVVNRGAEEVAGAVITKGLQASGLEPKPNYTTVNNTTVIPKFDFDALSPAYEARGINYGGLPSNRVEFLAAQNTPEPDFGASVFNKFQRMSPLNGAY